MGFFVNMPQKQRKMFGRLVIAIAMLTIYGVLELTGLCKLLPASEPLIFGYLFLVYLVIGYDIMLRALRGIGNGQLFDENFLMAVATVGAMALGDIGESVAVMLFYQIGEFFQSYAVGKSRRNIAELMDIRPDYANRLRGDGSVEVVAPEEVEIGSILVVRPGEKIPMDGVVCSGNASLNTSALTGESMPREVVAGDEVASGCINMSGVLHIRTLKEFGESTASKILEMVEFSGMKKSRSENFITKFAKIYTPAVCIGALLLALLPPCIHMLLGNAAMWGEWIRRALTFLVISCPCALVISIPLSFFGGIGGASAKGILIKGSNYLETLAQTKYVVFDKTGTLTKGTFSVTKCYSRLEDEERLMYYAASAEQASNHPIAKSIVAAYEKTGSMDRLGTLENLRETGGYGILAIVDGKEVLVGNQRLMQQTGISDFDGDVSEDWLGTVIHVAIDHSYAGCMCIADEEKEHSKETVAALKKSSIDTIMLTGDAKKIADHVAASLGVQQVKSELLPADKVTVVEELLKQKGKREKLAFVGDGINDAPVLARADIGIAMGALGSDAAIEAADIVLMDDDPLKLVLAMKISRKTLRIVYENIVFALGVKAVCLLLGALGVAGMWLAIFADVGVMVLAVLNATRALKNKY